MRHLNILFDVPGIKPPYFLALLIRTLVPDGIRTDSYYQNQSFRYHLIKRNQVDDDHTVCHDADNESSENSPLQIADTAQKMLVPPTTTAVITSSSRPRA